MTVSATLLGTLLHGVAASRPAANAVAGGTVYSATDTGAITQSDGSSWATFATISSGLADPMTTRGDIIVRNASNVTARLAIGSTGKVLSSDGTDISWQTPAAATARGARATNTAGTSISNNSLTAVPFAGEDFDTDAFHDTSSNNTRITVPSGLDGKYLAVAQATFANANVADILLLIRKNGTADVAYAGAHGAITDIAGHNASAVVALVATDYVEMIVKQQSGSSQALITAAGYNTLSLTRLGS